MAVLGEIVAVVVGRRYLAMVGVALIALGLVSLMPVLRDYVGKWELDFME